MPAKSVKQQKVMAIALKSPSKLTKKNVGLKKMGKNALHDFASTKLKGLPMKVQKIKKYKVKKRMEY